VRQLAQAVPLERLGQPSDIADIVAFLSSPAGHWINGQVVRANGGLVRTAGSAEPDPSTEEGFHP